MRLLGHAVDLGSDAVSWVPQTVAGCKNGVASNPALGLWRGGTAVLPRGFFYPPDQQNWDIDCLDFH